MSNFSFGTIFFLNSFNNSSFIYIYIDFPIVCFDVLKFMSCFNISNMKVLELDFFFFLCYSHKYRTSLPYVKWLPVL